MTTPPQDPFMQPPPPPGNVPPPPAPSAANVPPPYPAAAGYGLPSPYPGYGQMRVDPPRALATWTIILTGLYTASTLVLALLGPSTIDQMRDSLANPSTSPSFTNADIVNLLSLPVVVGSWVTLAIWWGQVRKARAAAGYVTGGIPAVEWWGWIVPFASAVLPFLGMRSLTRKLVGIGPLLGWWLAWLGTSVVGIVAVVITFTAMDLTTGTLTNPDALDGLVPVYWASAGLLAVSWAFLVYIIRTTTAKCNELGQ